MRVQTLFATSSHAPERMSWLTLNLWQIKLSAATADVVGNENIYLDGNFVDATCVCEWIETTTTTVAFRTERAERKILNQWCMPHCEAEHEQMVYELFSQLLLLNSNKHFLQHLFVFLYCSSYFGCSPKQSNRPQITWSGCNRQIVRKNVHQRRRRQINNPNFSSGLIFTWRNDE